MNIIYVRFLSSKMDAMDQIEKQFSVLKVTLNQFCFENEYTENEIDFLEA